MEQTKRYRGQHGPSKYFTEEERKEAIKRSKTKYMLKISCTCPQCQRISH